MDDVPADNPNPVVRNEKGQIVSGVLNTKGRPKAGVALREMLNAMADYTLEDLQAVLEDATKPAVYKAAARAWLDACSGIRTVSGVPTATTDFYAIIEQTAGKPLQPTENAGSQTIRVVYTDERTDGEAPPPSSGAGAGQRPGEAI